LRPLEKAFKAHYDSKGYKNTKIYPGIDKLLLDLKRSGIKVYIATNKRIHPTEKILNLLEWNNFFEGIYALDVFSPPARSKTELLEKIMVRHKFKHEKIVYIGDRKEDKLSSESHGIPFIRANWGYDPVSVSDHKVATSPADLQIMLA
jgi:phosphoglycolate phosphatase